MSAFVLRADFSTSCIAYTITLRAKIRTTPANKV